MAIICTNDSLLCWCIYASLGLVDLMLSLYIGNLPIDCCYIRSRSRVIPNLGRQHIIRRLELSRNVSSHRFHRVSKYSVNCAIDVQHVWWFAGLRFFRPHMCAMCTCALDIMRHVAVIWMELSSRLFGAKPLPRPMMTNCQMGLHEKGEVKFELKYKMFHWRYIFASVVSVQLWLINSTIRNTAICILFRQKCKWPGAHKYGRISYFLVPLIDPLSYWRDADFYTNHYIFPIIYIYIYTMLTNDFEFRIWNYVQNVEYIFRAWIWPYLPILLKLHNYLPHFLVPSSFLCNLAARHS